MLLPAQLYYYFDTTCLSYYYSTPTRYPTTRLPLPDILLLRYLPGILLLRYPYQIFYYDATTCQRYLTLQIWASWYHLVGIKKQRELPPRTRWPPQI